MAEYTIRWRNGRREVRELDAAGGLAQTLRGAVDTATVICSGYDTQVAVVEDGCLVCVVKPDAK